MSTKGKTITAKQLQARLGYKTRKSLYDLMKRDPSCPQPTTEKGEWREWSLKEFEIWEARRDARSKAHRIPEFFIGQRSLLPSEDDVSRFVTLAIREMLSAATRADT